MSPSTYRRPTPRACATCSRIPRSIFCSAHSRQSPDLTTAEIRRIARTLIAHNIDGVIATNSTVDRATVAGSPHADEAGGLSGRPLFKKSTAVLRILAKELDGAIPIIGVGGIMSGADAQAKIAAGATLVQIYTGLIYRGPELVAEIAQALADR